MKLAILTKLAITGAAAAALFGVLAAPASASASASASAATAKPAAAAAASIDGSDPAGTGCDSGAYTAKSAYAYKGSTPLALIELRYSPRCLTTWARITTMNVPNCVSGVDYCGQAFVHRNSDGRQYSCTIRNGAHGCYTPQVYDSHVTSYASGYVDFGRDYSATTGSY